MTYELAIKLKKAEFPLRCILKGEAIYHQHREVFTEEGNKSYLVPLLSELIEACGDRLYSVANLRTFWWAGSWDKVAETGPTPEEAVAKLWIALSKNG